MLMRVIEYNRVDTTHAHINGTFTSFVKGWVGRVALEQEVFYLVLGLLVGGVDGDLDTSVRVNY